ncbi:MAG TPA: hypothetical protein VFV46_07120 [Lacibacter sp.]|nr:hypothetical protein [Lacibacter sp.]
MNDELLQLRKQMNRMRWFIFILSGIIMIIFIFTILKQEEKSGILRAKGIIIEDSAGRDRILIGSPIPFSKHRVRTDTNLVRKYWAPQFEEQADQYMKWYRDYYNGAEGIVIMNERGFDRVLLGDKLADPNTGKRMFQSAGILWNDQQGWELGGAGVNTTKDGKARSVIGVDDKDGEAVHIIALEDGTKGLVIGGENGRLLIGMSKKDGQWFQNKETFTGIKYFDSNGKLVWQQQMNQK